MADTENREAWGSRIGLILAMAGNAVGLGNFLRFPAQAVQNGGGAFIIPYLVCFVLMGLPLLYVEWAMGRHAGNRGHHSTPFIFGAMDKRSFWKYAGVLGLFISIGICAYYTYIEAWTLSWAYHSAMGHFMGMSQDQVAAFFKDYIALGTSEPIMVWVLCVTLNTWILSRGLQGGVEMAAKIGMPLLLLFGVVLALRGVTLTAGEHGAVNSGVLGLNFLWTPNFSSIWDPVVWRNAAGQIFFTLSLGMGSIHCYASYVKSKDDIALNAMSAGWMNEFVEVVLGSAIIIPIAVGYLGVDKVVEMTRGGSGFGIGFMTLPYLFTQWGPVLSALSGIMWFGLLFFAGITSSLAMGTPVMAFMEDEFGWKRRNGALFFGVAVLLLGIPSVLSQEAFNEFDYWAGTIALVVFSLVEIILFAWVFGMEKGWKAITAGADMKVPVAFKFVIKYVTPVFLLVVFIGSLPDIWATLTKPITFHVALARGLMLALFAGLAWLVYLAGKRRASI